MRQLLSTKRKVLNRKPSDLGYVGEVRVGGVDVREFVRDQALHHFLRVLIAPLQELRHHRSEPAHISQSRSHIRQSPAYMRQSHAYIRQSHAHIRHLHIYIYKTVTFARAPPPPSGTCTYKRVTCTCKTVTCICKTIPTKGDEQGAMPVSLKPQPYTLKP